MQNFWTEQKLLRLKYLLVEGWTYTQIGTDLGISRSAVSGKVDRLGLGTPKQTPIERERARARAAARNAENKRRARGSIPKAGGFKMQQTVVKQPVSFTGLLNIPYAELRDFKSGAPNQCRFIAEEAASPLYLACGTETSPGASWCEQCKSKVFKRGNEVSDEFREVMSRNATRRFRSTEIKLLRTAREEAA